jgi:hypothetical protein
LNYFRNACNGRIRGHEGNQERRRAVMQAQDSYHRPLRYLFPLLSPYSSIIFSLLSNRCLGNARKEYLRTALEAGMNSYIVKPYQKEDLFAKIHELVKLNIDV